MPKASFSPLPGSWPLPRTKAQGSGTGTAPHSAGAVALLSHFPATIKLERPARVHALRHLVPKRTERVSHGAYGVSVTEPVRSSSPSPFVWPGVPHPRLASPRPQGCYEDVGCLQTHSAPRHRHPLQYLLL